MPLNIPNVFHQKHVNPLLSIGTKERIYNKSCYFTESNWWNRVFTCDMTSKCPLVNTDVQGAAWVLTWHQLVNIWRLCNIAQLLNSSKFLEKDGCILNKWHVTQNDPTTTSVVIWSFYLKTASSKRHIYLMKLVALYLVWVFTYFHTWCNPAEKALARQHV